MVSTVLTVAAEAILARAFPGAVVWLRDAHSHVTHAAFGTKSYDDAPGAAWAGAVTTDTVYDIASVSKLFTLAGFVIAARAAGVSVETPVASVLPEFAVSDKRPITLRQLLNHSSGIEIAIQSFTGTPTIEGSAAERHRGEVTTGEWVARIAAAPLKTAPGAAVLYSCTNYFLLARVAERLCGQRLDRFLMEQVMAPLGLRRTSFTPLEVFGPADIAPTEVYAGSVAPWHGVVHDEAARTWQAETGGFCGNAGVFTTAADLARFLDLWLDEGAARDRAILHPDDVRRSFTDTVPEDDIRRGWGWQVDAWGYMSKLAPPGSAGHTGFTGPTVWLNPTTRHLAVILENRVYPTRNGPNRMEYHRRIAEWLMTGG